MAATCGASRQGLAFSLRGGKRPSSSKGYSTGCRPSDDCGLSTEIAIGIPCELGGNANCRAIPIDIESDADVYWTRADTILLNHELL